MPAREIIKFRDLIKPQLGIHYGQRIFGRVDRAFFERLINLSAGNECYRGAQSL